MGLKSFCGLVFRFTSSEIHSNVFSFASILNSDGVSLVVRKKDRVQTAQLLECFFELPNQGQIFLMT